MKNNWNLYIAGFGSIDAASDMLTTFVSKLRDLGLKITNVQVIEGLLHENAQEGLETSEQGWTCYCYGEGDITPHRTEFTKFLGQFEGVGLRLVTSDMVVGELRTDLAVASY